MSAGDLDAIQKLFLLTPLREGRRAGIPLPTVERFISTHAPAGGATVMEESRFMRAVKFLLTPLREGRHKLPVPLLRSAFDFYSRPCGRGD